MQNQNMVDDFNPTPITQGEGRVEASARTKEGGGVTEPRLIEPTPSFILHHVFMPSFQEL